MLSPCDCCTSSSGLENLSWQISGVDPPCKFRYVGVQWEMGEHDGG